MRLMKAFFISLLVLVLGAGVVWFIAGRSVRPAIELVKPARAVGQNSELVVDIATPEGKLSRLDVVLEQNGTRWPVVALANGDTAHLQSIAKDRVRLVAAIGRKQAPELQAGRARIVVSAARKVLFGIRSIESTASRDVEVRLTPPAVAVVSTFHYVNQGGSEMVVYRVTPADGVSGVRVGEHEYLGFAASGADASLSDPSLRVAFFAVLWNQDAKAPITVFARDDAGNEGSAGFDYRIFNKVFRASKINVDDKYLANVVPQILRNSTEFKVGDPANLLDSYVRINRDLRRMNNATIAALAGQTSSRMLWQGPFKQLGNTAVEAGFADQRTYVYQGKEIDRQVHLGFDLASTAAAPVLAANNGKVVFAGWLGIYGNCVIVDHGMGLQSLYAHLSSIEVKVGDTINRDARLGRSGATGLAGGDHLHFTLLLGGNAVTPVDWWSSKWVQDRVVRKLREARDAKPSVAASR
jgi:murein DD-endopeptidase MepM/ murein hydrolase activator NlpD